MRDKIVKIVPSGNLDALDSIIAEQLDYYGRRADAEVARIRKTVKDAVPELALTDDQVGSLVSAIAPLVATRESIIEGFAQFLRVSSSGGMPKGDQAIVLSNVMQAVELGYMGPLVQSKETFSG